MKNLTQKTSRKPKKTKKKKNNIPGLLEKEKCKNQKNLEKTKKNKNNQYSRTLGKGKMQKSKKPRENQKKKFTKKQYSRTLVCRPHLQTSGILFFLFFLFFLVFSRFFGFLHFYFCKSPGILFFFFLFFLVFSRFFWFFGFLLLQESWNIVFLWVFLVFSRFFSFFFLWHSQTTGANTNKTCKEVGFCLGGTIYISGRDFPGRISAGTKLTCNSFLIQCKLAFILINVYFSLFFPWFQCYALFCCKYLYGIAPF